MSKDLPLVKIAFRDDDGDVEILWAIDLGNGHYRLDSSPWFQYGVSWMDIVAAEPEDDGLLFFVGTVEKGGHRTLRIASDSPINKSVLDSLTSAGCTFEGATRNLYAIDVPPSVDLHEIVEILNNSELQWEYADPTYEQLPGAGA